MTRHAEYVTHVSRVQRSDHKSGALRVNYALDHTTSHVRLICITQVRNVATCGCVGGRIGSIAQSQRRRIRCRCGARRRDAKQPPSITKTQTALRAEARGATERARPATSRACGQRLRTHVHVEFALAVQAEDDSAAMDRELSRIFLRRAATAIALASPRRCC